MFFLKAIFANISYFQVSLKECHLIPANHSSILSICDPGRRFYFLEDPETLGHGDIFLARGLQTLFRRDAVKRGFKRLEIDSM